MNTSVADILELSVAERIEIVEDIWDIIAADSREPLITDELRSEFDRRLHAYDKSPEAGVSWEELSERLTKSRCRKFGKTGDERNGRSTRNLYA